jgi:general secretion pathway protein D
MNSNNYIYMSKNLYRIFTVFFVILFIGVNVGYAKTNGLVADNIEQTESQKKETDGKRIWNLDNVDILALIGEMSRITRRNFVIDPRVSGKASLISNEPMDDEQAYQSFLSILQVLGFAVVESGSVTKILPSSVAKQYDTKVNATDIGALGEEMLVQVVALKHVQATALIPILRNLVNQQGHIAPYSPSNVLVIADHAKNVARIVEIVKRIDQENVDEVEIITLKDASADEIVKVLNNLLTKNQPVGEPSLQQVKMAADLRTNSILLSGDKSKRIKMRALIAQMDVPTPRTGDTEVIYLQYQKAEDLVPVLASVIEAYYEQKAGNSTTPDSGGNIAATNRRSAGGASRAGQYNSRSSSSSSAGANGSMTSTVELSDVRRGAGTLSAQGVQAEPNTNALVITAPQELMRSIKAVIAQLDIRRYQVLVEALIVEVSMQHLLNMGIEWRLPHHQQGFGGGTNFGIPTEATNAGGLINGANATNPLLKNIPLSGVTIGFLRGGDIRAIISALGQDINTNILSTPSLVTMDNEDAEIIVADKIPFKTSANTSSISESNNTINTFKYENVGLKLKLTPMITKGNAVKLALEQTTGDVLTRNTDTPTTTERTIKTVVVVDNKDVLVLGGLISGKKEYGESKIPFLGDLPFIGNFFKRASNGLVKKNLMVFIRPIIIRDSEQSHNVSLNKYDLMRDGQLLYKIDPAGKIARENFPELPDLDERYGDTKRLTLPMPFKQEYFNQALTDPEIFR